MYIEDIIKKHKYFEVMVGRITYLSREKFVACGVFAQENLEYITNDFVFIRKDSLELRRLEETRNICQKYSKLNLNTIVVRSSEHLTVWVEDREKSFLKRIETIQSKNNLAQYHSASENKTVHKYRGREYEKEKITTNRNLICTQKVIKKYRGQTYQEAVVNWSSLKPEKPPEKFRRKYRGQYID